MFIIALSAIAKNLETIQICVNWWETEQNVLHPHDAMLLGNRREGTIDTQDNMEEWHQTAMPFDDVSVNDGPHR